MQCLLVLFSEVFTCGDFLSRFLSRISTVKMTISSDISICRLEKLCLLELWLFVSVFVCQFPHLICSDIFGFFPPLASCQCFTRAREFLASPLASYYGDLVPFQTLDVNVLHTLTETCFACAILRICLEQRISIGSFVWGHSFLWIYDRQATNLYWLICLKQLIFIGWYVPSNAILLNDVYWLSNSSTLHSQLNVELSSVQFQ